MADKENIEEKVAEYPIKGIEELEDGPSSSRREDAKDDNDSVRKHLQQMSKDLRLENEIQV